MIKKLVIYLLTINFTLQSCNKGCLKCNKENECQICDLFKFKVKSGVSCADAEVVSNCSYINSQGTCLECENGYYISGTQCVAVTTVIPNCLKYNGASNCAACQGHRNPKTNCSDIPVANQVANCQYYMEVNSVLKCEDCSDTYYLDVDQCKRLPSDQNCFLFSKFKCDQCTMGEYIFNNNLSSLQNTVNFDNVQNQEEIIDIIKNPVVQYDNTKLVCQKVEVLNCATLMSFDKCEVCNVNYYKTWDNKCAENPDDQILNCSKYKNEFTCSKCNVGYLLNSFTGQLGTPNQCIAISGGNDNCIKFDQSKTQQVCLECNSDHYQSGSSCNLRNNNNITNCSSYNLKEDQCLNCTSGYTLSNDKTFCATEITNCLVYDITKSGETVSKICVQCKDYYYLNEDKSGCLNTPVKVDKCRVYENGTCKFCENKYFLNSNSCEHHDTIDQCSVYGQQRRNICLECNQGYFPFGINNTCESNLKEIDNCESYTSRTNQEETSDCSKCMPGYKISGKECVIIGNKCEIEQNGVCTQCFNDIVNGFHGLGKDEQDNIGCYEPFAFQKNCLSYITNDQLKQVYTFQCEVCMKNSLGYSILNHNVCIADTRFNTIDYPNLIKATNCLMYVGEDCKQCKRGSYLTTDRQCVNTCANQVRPFDSDLNEYYNANRCMTGNESANELIDVEALSTNSNFIPISCKDNVFTVIQAGIEDVEYSNIRTTHFDWFKDDKYQFTNPEVSCLVYDGPAQSVLINNCQFYQDFEGIYQCVKCIINKTSSVINSGNLALPNCDGTLESCQDSNILPGTRYQNMHQYWEKYLSCNVCNVDTDIPVLIGVFQIDVTEPSLSNYVRFNIANSNDDWVNEQAQTYEQTVQCWNNSDKTQLTNRLHLQNEDKLVHINSCGAYGLHLSVASSRATFDNTKSNIDNQNFELDTNQLFCLFCLPGYKPIYKQNTEKKVVTSCTKIDNCADNTDSVNICNQCQQGYFHQFDDNDEIRFDLDCVPGLDKQANCMALQVLEDLEKPKKCRVCKKGYFLNEDSLCTNLSLQNCSTWNQFPLDSDYMFNNNNNNHNFVFYVNWEGFGCNDCQENYTSIKVNAGQEEKQFTESFACFTSSLLMENENLVFDNKIFIPDVNAERSYYIDKCQNYSAQYRVERPICQQCMDTFILQSDGQECLAQNTLPNCKIAEDSDNCSVCNDNYGLKTSPTNKAACNLNEILHCKNVNTDQQQDKVYCLSCNANYYLNDANNSCEQGSIPNCLSHPDNEPLKCNVCEEGFLLISSEFLSQFQGILGLQDISRDYCFKVPASLLCKDQEMLLKYNTLDNFEEGKIGEIGDAAVVLQCNECKSPWLFPMKIQPTLQDHRCLQYIAVSNCMSYVIGDNLSDSNFSCSHCNDDFFRDNYGYACNARTHKPADCTEYNLQEDKCLDCGENSWVSNDGQTCNANPKGFLGCRIYKLPENSTQNSQYECIACDENFYLYSPTECKFVVTQMNNCRYYESDTKCKQCNDDNILMDTPTNNSDFTNSCVAATDIKCTDYIDNDNCENCDVGYYLNAQQQCVVNTDAMCELYQRNSKICEYCKITEPYYVNSEGKCTQITVIQNCNYYDSATTCKQCNSESALAADRKSCLVTRNFDANCSLKSIPSEEVCVICNPGFKFSGTTCVAVDGNASYSSGCLLSDLTNNDVCLICRSGYYMNSNFLCNDENPDVENVGYGELMGTIFAVFVIIF